MDSLSVKKIPAPRFSIRKITTLEDLSSIHFTNYRQCIDIVLEHIQINHLQDENQRIKIILDNDLKNFFEIYERDSISVFELHPLVKSYIEKKATQKVSTS